MNLTATQRKLGFYMTGRLDSLTTTLSPNEREFIYTLSVYHSPFMEVDITMTTETYYKLDGLERTFCIVANNICILKPIHVYTKITERETRRNAQLGLFALSGVEVAAFEPDVKIMDNQEFLYTEPVRREVDYMGHFWHKPMDVS